MVLLDGLPNHLATYLVLREALLPLKSLSKTSCEMLKLGMSLESIAPGVSVAEDLGRGDQVRVHASRKWG